MNDEHRKLVSEYLNLKRKIELCPTKNDRKAFKAVKEKMKQENIKVIRECEQ